MRVKESWTSERNDRHSRVYIGCVRNRPRGSVCASPSALENERATGGEAARARDGRARDGGAAITGGREEEGSGGRTRGEGSMPVARTTTAPDLPSIHPGERVLLAQSDPVHHDGAEGGQGGRRNRNRGSAKDPQEEDGPRSELAVSAPPRS